MTGGVILYCVYENGILEGYTVNDIKAIQLRNAKTLKMSWWTELN